MRFTASNSGAASDRRPNQVRTWAWAGAACGLAIGLVTSLPASWIARSVGEASGGRLVLAQAEGTVWTGSALLVLAGGPGSHAASALPARLQWRLRPAWSGARLRLSQDCCMARGVGIELHLGKDTRLELADTPDGDALAQWPAGWLEGLGAPWNTLRPGGLLRLHSRGLGLVRRQGEWRLRGQARLEILQASASATTLDTLGSYRLVLDAADETGGATPDARLTLDTLEGALRLSGHGQVGPAGLRLRGQAEAAPGSEGALNNLLNLIGPRDGARAVISIG